MPTYMPAYLPADQSTDRPAYLPAWLPTYLRAYLPTYLLAYLPTCLPACLRTYLPTYPPTDRPTSTYLPTSPSTYTYLPTYLPTDRPIDGQTDRQNDRPTDRNEVVSALPVDYARHAAGHRLEGDSPERLDLFHGPTRGPEGENTKRGRWWVYDMILHYVRFFFSVTHTRVLDKRHERWLGCKVEGYKRNSAKCSASAGQCSTTLPLYIRIIFILIYHPNVDYT